MNWLDLFIVLFLIASIMRGIEVGFVRQFFSTAGFFVGFFFGALVESRAVNYLHTNQAKVVVALLLVFGFALLLMTIGEYAGLRLKFTLKKSKVAERIDNIAGSVLAGATLLAMVWLGASLFRNTPDTALHRQINTSGVVSVLNAELPPVPDILNGIGHLIDPNGFPQVFAGLEPTLPMDTPVPEMGPLTAAVHKDRASIVKITGKGCGGVVEGTGFIAAENQVITNAHVVAGVGMIKIIDQNGEHSAIVTGLDPELDMAVLRTAGLKGQPLRLNNQIVAKGNTIAIAGYPWTNGFTAWPGVILDIFTANGRNIYGKDGTAREVYSIKVDVEPGNSGGPVITSDGSVVGVIFAKSTNYDQVGYALTIGEVARTFNRMKNNTVALNTGSCAQ